MSRMWAGPEKGAGAIRGLETDPEGPRVHAENCLMDFPVKSVVPTFVRSCSGEYWRDARSNRDSLSGWKP